MSMSIQNSNSSSTPEVVSTPENSILDQLSGVAAGLADQMYGWAQGVFAQTSQITNQAIGNFFDVSQQMTGLSNNLTSQYNNLFAPENAQLVADANSYASPARMAVDMGQAGATQAQAGDAALHNSEEALKSFGIDPSSGRYAALDKAAQVQNAANVAGAENTQRNADIATGQRLRSEAVQVGAQLPSSIANVNNTVTAANTAASNASLANANTGRNLMSLPNDFLKTATGIPLSPVAQRSQSSSQGSSSSSGNQGSHGGGSGSGGAGGAGSGAGARGSGAPWMPDHGGAGSQGITQPRIGGGPGAKISGLPGGGGGDWGFDNPLNGIDPNSFDGNDPNNIYQPDPFGANMGIGDQGSNDNAWNNDNGTGFGDPNPFDDSGFGQTLPSDQFGGADQTFGDMGGGTDTEWGNIGYDPNANDQGAAADWGNVYDQPNPNTDWGNGADQYTGGGGDSGSSGDSSAFDSGSSGYDDYGYGGGDYAQGGLVRPRLNMTRGGRIPVAASPSRGQRVDDIKANVNAGEFVIPKDVVGHKGSEFFQKLIAQSRKARMVHQARQRHAQPMR